MRGFARRRVVAMASRASSAAGLRVADFAFGAVMSFQKQAEGP